MQGRKADTKLQKQVLSFTQKLVLHKSSIKSSLVEPQLKLAGSGRAAITKANVKIYSAVTPLQRDGQQAHCG